MSQRSLEGTTLKESPWKVEKKILILILKDEVHTKLIIPLDSTLYPLRAKCNA